jgi:hypothetical protein
MPGERPAGLGNIVLGPLGMAVTESDDMDSDDRSDNKGSTS